MNAMLLEAPVRREKANIYYIDEGDGSVEIGHQLSDESYVASGICSAP
jgi:hypothetical protein